MIRPILLPLGLLFLFTLPGLAQTPVPAFDPSRAAAATLREDARAQSRLQGPIAQPQSILAEENAFAPESPADADIGQQLILKRNERQRDFGLYLNSAMFYTDNAAQVSAGAKEDWFFAGGATFTWQPRIARRFYFDSFVSENWYRYDKFNILDYEALEGSAGVIVLMPEIWNTLWHVHYYYERITQGIDETPIYQTHNIRAGVQKALPIDHHNSINLSLLASLSLDATPRELQRHEYSAAVGWNYKVTHRWLLNLSYRVLYYDYFNLEGRQDWNHNFAAALIFRPWEWMDLVASWNYTLNRSNKPAFDYDTQLAGPALSIKARF